MIGEWWTYKINGTDAVCTVTEEHKLPCGCVFQQYERQYSNHPIMVGHRLAPDSEPAGGHRKVCLKR